MKIKSVLFFVVILCLSSCMKNEPRRPVTKSKSYTLADTSYEMKKINQLEDQKVKFYMQQDSLTSYSSSSSGYWFAYLNKVESESPNPVKGDLVELEYEIRSLNNELIYSKDDLGTKLYKVDKEDFIPALQLGVKQMKVGETFKFVIPSYSAYGIAGDDDKIGINQSIISIVTLLNIKKENEDN